jgi:hypothetical protein
MTWPYTVLLSTCLGRGEEHMEGGLTNKRYRGWIKKKNGRLAAMSSNQISVLEGYSAMSSQEKINQKPKHKINKCHNTKPEECTLYHNFKKRKRQKTQNKKKKTWMLRMGERCIPLGSTIPIARYCNQEDYLNATG